jgi:hypothetical protein
MQDEVTIPTPHGLIGPKEKNKPRASLFPNLRSFSASTAASWSSADTNVTKQNQGVVFFNRLHEEVASHGSEQGEAEWIIFFRKAYGERWPAKGAD